MSDDGKPTIDDLVTTDEFESLESRLEDIASAVAGDGTDDDSTDEGTELPDGIVTDDELPDFEDFTDKDEAAEVADRTFMSRMSHLVNEDCDTEACNEIREKFGIDPTDSEQESDHDHDDEDGESADGGDSSEDGSDADDPEDDPEDGGNDRTPFEVV